MPIRSQHHAKNSLLPVSAYDPSTGTQHLKSSDRSTFDTCRSLQNIERELRARTRLSIEQTGRPLAAIELPLSPFHKGLKLIQRQRLAEQISLVAQAP